MCYCFLIFLGSVLFLSVSRSMFCEFIVEFFCVSDLFGTSEFHFERLDPMLKTQPTRKSCLQPAMWDYFLLQNDRAPIAKYFILNRSSIGSTPEGHFSWGKKKQQQIDAIDSAIVIQQVLVITQKYGDRTETRVLFRQC